MLQLLLALLLAIGVSAFCSISEAAFYSISVGAVKKLTESTTKSAQKAGLILKEIKENIDPYIASVLILNTLANTSGVVLATDALVREFPEVPMLAISAGLTILILLFAEIIPKTIGANFSRKMAPFVARPFYIINIVFTWMGLVWLALRLTRIFRNKAPQNEEVSTDEIHSLASLSAEMGVIDNQQEQVIKNILHLKNHTVREIMTPRRVIFALELGTTIRKSIHKEGNWQFSRVPIFKESRENLVGMVLRRDAYTALAENKDHLTLKEIMRPLKFVPETLKLDALLTHFLKNQIHLVAVADEYGGLAGIVTLEDVLEEVLGKEIIDEFDQAVDMQQKARAASPALAAIQIQNSSKKDQT